MGTKPPESEGINNGHINQQQVPNQDDRTVKLEAYVTVHERDFLTTITSILSKIDIDGRKIITNNEVAELIRVSLTYTSQVYMGSIFSDPAIVKRLPNKDSIKEFMAFRKKYMNMPIDTQLTELKRMGIVKAKQKA